MRVITAQGHADLLCIVPMTTVNCVVSTMIMSIEGASTCLVITSPSAAPNGGERGANGELGPKSLRIYMYLYVSLARCVARCCERTLSFYH